MGGTLSDLFSYPVPSYLASALALVNLLSAYFQLAEPSTFRDPKKNNNILYRPAEHSEETKNHAAPEHLFSVLLGIRLLTGHSYPLVTKSRRIQLLRNRLDRLLCRKRQRLHSGSLASQTEQEI